MLCLTITLFSLKQSHTNIGMHNNILNSLKIIEEIKKLICSIIKKIHSENIQVVITIHRHIGFTLIEMKLVMLLPPIVINHYQCLQSKLSKTSTVDIKNKDQREMKCSKWFSSKSGKFTLDLAWNTVDKVSKCASNKLKIIWLIITWTCHFLTKQAIMHLMSNSWIKVY